ncbi:hypothetical protein LTR17_023149 [Elasticomyces elasticus]|nr:hypothetical protein LTR17_023149 [Elasticomyces elasticus]
MEASWPYSQNTRAWTLKILDHILEALVPAPEATSQSRSSTDYVGTYVSSSDAEGNSTIVVSTLNASAPGLVVQTWISNSIGVLASYFPQRNAPPTTSDLEPETRSSDRRFQATQYKQWNTYATANVGPMTGFYDSDLG